MGPKMRSNQDADLPEDNDEKAPNIIALKMFATHITYAPTQECTTAFMQAIIGTLGQTIPDVAVRLPSNFGKLNYPFKGHDEQRSEPTQKETADVKIVAGEVAFATQRYSCALHPTLDRPFVGRSRDLCFAPRFFRGYRQTQVMCNCAWEQKSFMLSLRYQGID